MNMDMMDEAFILIGVEGESKEDILTRMAENLVKLGVVKESYIAAVIEREQAYPTGLPTGGCSVAIPHTDIEHVNRKAISIGVLKQPVRFGIMGEEEETTPVELVFMLAMDQKHSQLKLLTRLMQVIQDQSMLRALSKETSPASIKELMNTVLQFEAQGGPLT
ncbi:PTS sugar transporter subunit IIA [Paenibacillus sp. LMG 31459]|uniref:PTS sugar transporter subunit IIA n=1 Tax=Paenibacillus phytohabitans TaxID=2654978 RepID=A0ABX1YQG5_9BACL|nr:PTS sugar transporter subunit IIA [Paenibacillus phytohabitans]NOU83327.1 PTS sugar transporter subunit IIA [Paenibacillus phytohabitans]